MTRAESNRECLKIIHGVLVFLETGKAWMEPDAKWTLLDIAPLETWLRKQEVKLSPAIKRGGR